MQFFWSNFAKYNNPLSGRTNKYNNGTIINWLNFNNTLQNTLIFKADNIQLIQNYDKDKCKVWDQISYPWLPHP